MTPGLFSEAVTSGQRRALATGTWWFKLVGKCGGLEGSPQPLKPTVFRILQRPIWPFVRCLVSLVIRSDNRFLDFTDYNIVVNLDNYIGPNTAI